MNPLSFQCNPFLPVEWVDDGEWEAIQESFHTISIPANAPLDRTLDETSPQTLDQTLDAPASPSCENKSMASSALLTPSSAHQFSDSLSGRPSTGVACEVSDSFVKQNDIYRRIPKGKRPWRSVEMTRQVSSWNISAGAGSSCSHSAADIFPEIPSNDGTPGEISESTLGNLPGSPGQLEILPLGSSFLEISSPETGRDEPLSRPAARRIPSWISHDRQSSLRLHSNFCKSLKNTVNDASLISSSVQPRILLNGGNPKGVPAAPEITQEHSKMTQDLSSNPHGHDEQRSVLSTSVHQTVASPPGWVELVKPSAELPWGINPSTFVEAVSCKLPLLQFRGQIVYSKTESEVDAACLVLCERVRELQQTIQGAIPIGFDLEWKAFERGDKPKKVAVLQLCLDSRRCDVMQIIYSGIPSSLRNLLEEASTIKVGVAVHADAAKLCGEYQINTRKLLDLRVVANQKMKNTRQWSLSSLVQEFTGKQVDKNQSIRCGDWEAFPLSEPQLQYAATDAFASLHLYQVLASLSNPTPEKNQDSVNTNIE